MTNMRRALFLCVRRSIMRSSGNYASLMPTKYQTWNSQVPTCSYAFFACQTSYSALRCSPTHLPWNFSLLPRQSFTYVYIRSIYNPNMGQLSWVHRKGLITTCINKRTFLAKTFVPGTGKFPAEVRRFLFPLVYFRSCVMPVSNSGYSPKFSVISFPVPLVLAGSCYFDPAGHKLKPPDKIRISITPT